MASKLSGHRFEVHVSSALVRVNEVRTLWGSAALLESVIGDLGAIPLEDTLRWMLDA